VKTVQLRYILWFEWIIPCFWWRSIILGLSNRRLFNWDIYCGL